MERIPVKRNERILVKNAKRMLSNYDLKPKLVNLLYLVAQMAFQVPFSLLFFLIHNHLYVFPKLKYFTSQIIHFDYTYYIFYTY
jgi:hypothetical protein